jgi:hypothetical protein
MDLRSETDVTTLCFAGLSQIATVVAVDLSASNLSDVTPQFRTSIGTASPALSV